jgi:rhomboid family protein
MGIYDRDYYREATRNHLDGRVQAYVVLIVIYIAIYILQIATRDEGKLRQRPGPGPVTESLILNADKVMQGEVWRLVTFAFVHDPLNPMPLICNIIFLIFFGRFVEDIVGWKEFLGFYLVAGFLAGIGFTLVSGAGKLGGELAGPQASITAVLLLVALQNPKRTVLLFFVIPCPIWFVVVFNVLLDVAGYLGGHVNPIVLAAHAVTAGFAFVYFRYHLVVTSWLPSWFSGPRRPKAKPKLQIYRDTVDRDSEPSPASAGGSAPATRGAAPATASATATAASVIDEQLEAKLDEVLEKVKKYGQESLTEEERAVLFRASEIYRKRRKTGD